MLVLLLGCATPVDSGVDSAACADPAVTWDGWGQGFFVTWCGACHSATTPDRRGAPPGLDFDTWEEVQAHRDEIERSVLTEASMPVGGGLAADDLTQLQALLACGEGGDGTTSTAQLPSPALDATGIEAAAATAFAGGVPLATDYWSVYLELVLGHSDGMCPAGGLGAPYAIHAPMVGCTTEDGWYFSGLTLRETTEDADGWSEWMLGDGWAHDLEDHRLVFGGEIEWGADTSGAHPWQTVDGTWGWEAGEGWLAEVPSVSLATEADLATGVVTVTGGWTTGGESVFLDGVDFAPRADDAPSHGTLSVRDPGGAWYTVPLREDGSGCGPATYADGTALGEVCFDTAPLAASLAGIVP